MKCNARVAKVFVLVSYSFLISGKIIKDKRALNCLCMYTIGPPRVVALGGVIIRCKG